MSPPLIVFVNFNIGTIKYCNMNFYIKRKIVSASLVISICLHFLYD